MRLLIPFAAVTLMAGPAVGLPVNVSPADLVSLCVLGSNHAANGGFEQGSSSWSFWGSSSSPAPSIVSPGAAGSEHALATPGGWEWSYASQHPPSFDGRCMALAFDARLDDVGAGGGTVVTARGPTWPATLSVEFAAGKVTFRAGGSAWERAAPADGGWHHYRLEAHEAGLRLIVVDDSLSLATADIDLRPVDRLYIGDPGAVGSGKSSAARFDNVELRSSVV